MNFETAKYEHSLPAKSFFRTTVSGDGSILAVDFRWCLKSFPLRGAPRGFEESLHACSDYKSPPPSLSYYYYYRARPPRTETAAIGETFGPVYNIS